MKLTKRTLKDMIKEVLKENKEKSPLLFKGRTVWTKDRKVVQEGKRFFSMQRLNETTMTGLKGKYMENGFIVVTSDRSCQAELQLDYGEPCPESEVHYFQQNNIENREILKKWVRASGFGYTPVYGGYQEELKDESGEVVGHVDNPEPEHSLLIMARQGVEGKDHNALRTLGMQITDAFNQDSFFYKPPNNVDHKAYFIDRGGNVDMDFSNFVFGDLSQIYFTQLAKNKEKWHRHKRFSAIPEGLYVPKPPLSASEARERRGEIFVIPPKRRK